MIELLPGEKERIEDATRLIMPDFRFYDRESERAVWSEVQAWGLALKAKPSLPVALREFLRANLDRKSDLPSAWFYLAWARLLRDGKLEVDSYYQVKWWLYCAARGKLEVANFWGSANSGKSEWSGGFCVDLLVLWDIDCIGYVAGPWKSHTDDKVWKVTKKNADRMENSPLLKEFGIELQSKAQEIICTVPNQPGKGYLKFVAIQEASSVQGAKDDKSTDETGLRGAALLVADEFIENPNVDLEEIVGNFSNNYNFFGAFGCNPKPDKVMQANLLPFAAPIDVPVNEMSKSKHHTWATSQGRVIRFFPKNNPNFACERSIWHYLMSQKRMDNLAKKSEHIQAAQLWAWGFGSEGANTLTDRYRQGIAGVFDDFIYASDIHGDFLAVDPAFGGQDPAAFTRLQVADVKSKNSLDVHETSRRIIPVEQSTIGPIDADFIPDADFCNKVQTIMQYRIDNGDDDIAALKEIQPGLKPRGNAAMIQGAVLVAHYAITKGIPLRHVVFDASQRADAFLWWQKVFGAKNMHWYYEGTRKLTEEEGEDWFRWPYTLTSDKNGGQRLEKWSDYCSRTITMIWAFGCEAINNRLVINGKAAQKGLNELAAREVDTSSSGKVDVWSKDAIKQGKWRGKKIAKLGSPCYGETLSMGIYYICRYTNLINLGAKPETTTTYGGPGLNDDDFINDVNGWL